MLVGKAVGASRGFDQEVDSCGGEAGRATIGFGQQMAAVGESDQNPL